MQNKPVINFINVVKILEVKDMDYIFQLINSYSGETYIFKVYKELFDKAMEVRKISKLDVTVTSDNIEDEEQEKKSELNATTVYI